MEAVRPKIIRTYTYGLVVCGLVFFSLVLLILSDQIYDITTAILFVFCIMFLQFMLGFYRDLTLPSCLFSVFFMAFILVGFLFENILRGFSPLVFKAVIWSSLTHTFFAYLFKGVHAKRARAKVKLDHPSKSFSLVAISIAVVGVLCGLLFFLKIGHIPLFSNASPEERISAMQGNGYLLQPLRSAPIAAIACVFGTRYFKSGLVLFFVSNFLFLGTGFRGLFIQNLLYFILVYCLVNGKPFGYSYLIKSGLVLVGLIFALGLIRGDGFLISSVVFKLLHAFSVSILILEMVLTDFEDFKFGLTFLYKFTSVLPLPNIEYTQWLTSQLPLKFNGGVTPTLIGDFYINFGNLYWVSFIPLSWFLALLDKKIVTTTRLTSLLMISTISMGIARSATGGLSNTLFQTFLACVIVYILIAASRVKVH